MALLYFGLRRLALSPSTEMLVRSALGVPASLLFSHAFFWVFERRLVGNPAAFFGKRAG